MRVGGGISAAISLALTTHAELPTVHQNAPALIQTHAELPTVHQNAPHLIEAHALLPTVHQNAPQLITAHAGFPTVHQNAPQLITAHAGFPTVHQNAPQLITTHAQLPTVHQNAPQLISNHTGVAAAHHTPATAPKVKKETRNMASASGDVAYTGYGFQPTGLIIIATLTTIAGTLGSAEPALTEHCLAVWETAKAMVYNTTILWLSISAGNTQTAVLKTFDEDGFTLTWTKGGSPTGTANMHVFAFK